MVFDHSVFTNIMFGGPSGSGKASKKLSKMEYYSSDSSESDSSIDGIKTLDYSYLTLDSGLLEYNLDHFTDDESKPAQHVDTLLLYHNQISHLTPLLTRFTNLKYLDISSNMITELPSYLCGCPLQTLIAKNNRLSEKSLPSDFNNLTNLKELNLSGNRFNNFPLQVLDFAHIKYLYLGGNKISDIPRDVKKLQNLQVLSMGGNLLTEVPMTLGQLKQLTALVLSDNQLVSLPSAIANLKHLKSLLLHKNKLKTLPTEIITLKNLTELSLRDNPLVVRFVSDMTHSVPSLLELSARTVKLHQLTYGEYDLPKTLIEYLSTAHHCINPNCQGVFFDNRVEHVKFVDFCGKYRVPLLQYLCSSNCIDEKDDVNIDSNMMRKVLLG